MDRKIRVGAVSYYNTKPLIYGFEQGMMQDSVDLVIDYPAKIAQALLDNQIDVGLVPVAILPKMKEYRIITNYCIGAESEVASVCIFSEVPLEQVETILLDYQSRTSVALAQVLLKEYWKLSPRIEQAGPDFQQQIKGTTAAVLIGDRALKQLTVSPFIYDLATAWNQYTGLPFVFAAWISNRDLPEEWISQFNEANAFGLNHLDKVLKNLDFPEFDLHEYYTRYISYDLTDQKRAGLSLFLEHLKVPVEQI